MSPANRKSSPPESGGWWRDNWVKCIDAMAKVIAAFAVAGVAIIAHNFESAMSATTLLNQREQAETNLRAQLLHDLIATVTERSGAGKGIDAKRELVLVELLTLNFHDHFEFKPLLLDLDQRLEKDGDDQARRSLESVARRVVDRQVNRLVAIGRADNNPAESADVYFESDPKYQKEVVSPKSKEESEAAYDEASKGASGEATHELPGDCAQMAGPEPVDETVNTAGQPARFNEQTSLGQGVCVYSPDRQYYLEIHLMKIDVATGRAAVTATAYRVRSGDDASESPRFIAYKDFTITPYDFPLTDNAQINGSRRFALSLYEFESPAQARSTGVAEGQTDHGDLVKLKVVWFPKGFITERERPVNYLELRRSLGLDDRSTAEPDR